MAPIWKSGALLPEEEATVVVKLRKTMVRLEDAELRSPGLTKPMQRCYPYVHTPEAFGMGSELKELAARVHKENEEAKHAAEAMFEAARAESTTRFRPPALLRVLEQSI